jgi:Family of unknown function (DUF6495)
MKYRRLTLEELSELEKEFIHFLASNSIIAADWEKMKINNPSNVDFLIDEFSTIVMQNVLSKITYLEQKDSNSLLLFKTEKEVITILSITGKKSQISVIENYSPSEIVTNKDQFSIFTKQISYPKQREEYIFEMTQQGMSLSNGQLYESIINAMKC